MSTFTPTVSQNISNLMKVGVPGHQPKSVWVLMNTLVAENNAINLGQGMPSYPIDNFIKKAAISAIEADKNQYTRSQGHPRLVKALSKYYSPEMGLGREIDPMSEICTTCGASEALYGAFQGFLSQGDEIIVISPFFDMYIPQISLTGAKPLFWPLKPMSTGGEEADFPTSSAQLGLDFADIESQITPKTKALLWNSPHNPTGKVFTAEETKAVAEFAIKHNLLVISDEVYDQLVHPGSTHTRMASLPNMWERTITVGSAGKTFSATGWKCGWAIAPAALIKPTFYGRLNTSFCFATPLQEAIAAAFEAIMNGDQKTYFDDVRSSMTSKRDKLVSLLKDAGLRPVVPEGSYFVLADVSGLNVKLSPLPEEAEDVALARWLCSEIGVASIPVSPFLEPNSTVPLYNKVIRFCFAKDESILIDAGNTLKAKLAPYQN